MRAGALLAFAVGMVLALALAPPATADHPAGLAAGAAGVLPPAAPSPAPSVHGIARVGSTLTGRDGGWELSPTISRQWLRCDSAGNNCLFLHDTDLSHTLTTADVGRRIRLRVRATAVGGSREVDSTPTPSVVRQGETPAVTEKPSTLVPPTVQGKLREGEIILASPGIWLGSEPITFSNRWDRCDATRCVGIGVRRFLHKLGKADVGMRMRAAITASNSLGTSQRLSPQSAIVKPRLRRYDRLKPFPLIGIRGVITRGGVRLRRLAVRGPRGVTVGVACRGKGCPYRSVRGRMRKNLFLVRRLLDRTFSVGTVIELRVTARNRIGKYTRFRVVRNRPPARVDRCLVPGEARPSRCRAQR
jgi:hypothetical protein